MPKYMTAGKSAMKFGDLEEGDLFSTTTRNWITHMNVKVAEAVLVNGSMGIYNAVSLKDGRSRTFHPSERVYRYEITEEDKIYLKAGEDDNA